MGALSSVILKAGKSERVIAGHPWIYAGSIKEVSDNAHNGDVVSILDHRHRFLGVGFYNSESKINVRVLSREKEEINKQFFEKRVQEALLLRKKHLPGATSFRVVNAEGDFLSGLIVDKYEDVIVFQTSSLGMDKRKDLIIEVLKEIFSPRAIIEKNDISARKFEGLPESSGVVYGVYDGVVNVKINELVFPVDLMSGHKTGLYLDQQVNYLKVARFAKDKQVLDCFSFQGGFAFHCAKAGAVHIHALEQSPEAIATAQQAAQINRISDKISWENVNVFDWFKAKTTAAGKKVEPVYDMIILDPPSFTRSRSSVPDALRGYKEIHLRAFKLIKSGGILATFCCSHHVDAVMFQQVILDAAYDARVLLRKIDTYNQSPDHPIILSIPETEYLKGFAFEVIK